MELQGLTVQVPFQGYYFHTDNPYRDWPNAFTEGQERAREGDLNTAVLLLEAAILQDPQDAEVRYQDHSPPPAANRDSSLRNQSESDFCSDCRLTCISIRLRIYVEHILDICGQLCILW